MILAITQADSLTPACSTAIFIYGGLFDIVAVELSRALPFDPYFIGHSCALIGIGGSLPPGQPRGRSRVLARPVRCNGACLCGPWFGSMFNHTKDIRSPPPPWAR
jgi:hypothetical protein